MTTPALTIFISAVTAEFEDVREELAKLLRDFGEVYYQTAPPSVLLNGESIEALIERSDLIVCLVGHYPGYPLRAEGRPAYAGEGSWTQWEYDCARRTVGRDRSKRLSVFMKKHGVPPQPDPQQAEFRARIHEDEKRSFKGLFFATYSSHDSLLAAFNLMLNDRVKGLKAVQYGYWLKLKAAYGRGTRADWLEAMPNCYRDPADEPVRNALMAEDDAPFIETRGFSILAPGPGGRQLRHLAPAAFVTGRDTEFELEKRRQSTWNPLSTKAEREQAGARSDAASIVDVLRFPCQAPAVLGTVQLPPDIRLFLVSGSGIGKSTTLQWLEACVNGLHDGDPAVAAAPSRFAIRLQAGALAGVTAENLVEALARHVLNATSPRAPAWQRNLAAAGIEIDMQNGMIVLIIDGLDHIETTPQLLIDAQHPSQDGWTRCPIVVAGRPQALLHWRDKPGPTGAVAASSWRFLEPAEFTDDEAEVYLGSLHGVSRFELAQEHLGRLTSVPRILEYLRSLELHQIRKVRTASDIYFEAVKHLVREGLERPSSLEEGPFWQRPSGHPNAKQLERMMKLLSALGFISFCCTADPNHPESSESFKMKLDDSRRLRLLRRIDKVVGDPTELQWERLNQDLQAVATLTSVVGNGLLEELSARPSSSIDSVMWANRTVQQFFAALWLSCYADGADAVRDLLDGGKLNTSREPRYDVQRSRHYVFFPDADIKELKLRQVHGVHIEQSDVTYEFNMLLAEMPRQAIEKKESWIAAASAWYDPLLFKNEAAERRVWSSEMLYRSWPTMMHLARRAPDDWWDIPYDRLASLPPGHSRHAASPHHGAAGPNLLNDTDVAQSVLDGFFADFERILRDEANPAAAAAQQMIADGQWVRVPDAPNFLMGAASERQGCPTQKVDAYWQRTLLDPVQSQKLTAAKAAERGTWREWFVGRVGEKSRLDDIEWLEQTMKPLEADGKRRSLRRPDRQAPAYQDALRQIEARFKTHDETPEEQPQAIRAFEMHRFPVLYRWFYLFAPGHRRTIEYQLGQLAVLEDEDARLRLGTLPPVPGPDHPATYISWFDAWAFCQWATWRDPDSGLRYGLRLPHEPEWEFAARWTSVKGQPVQSEREWRWWWGDKFYTNETSPKPQIPGGKRAKRAHADGRPGCTRPPADAEPNGLGFHDILGNVWEWTANLYSAPKERDVLNSEKFTLRYSRHDPRIRPPVNGQRTMRGGIWYYLSILATSTNRFRYLCHDRDPKIGFRVVRERRPEQ